MGQLTVPLDNDCHDKPVDTQDTRHDHRNDISHHQAGVHHTHGADTYTTLGSSISRTQVCTMLSNQSRIHRQEEFNNCESLAGRWVVSIANKASPWHLLAKTIAAVTPMNPKKGADEGQVS